MNPKESGLVEQKEDSPDEKIKKELEADGWQKTGGIEDTHTTPLNPATGRFEPRPFRTPEDIEKECLKKYGENGFTEIKLVHTHSEKPGLGWFEDPYSYYVYMRRPEDKK